MKNQNYTNALENLRKINELENLVENQIADYIREEFEGEVRFTDKTGYPSFKDDSDDFYENVVAVRAVENKSGRWGLEFNTTTNPDGNPNQNGWFNPYHFGEVNLGNLFDYLPTKNAE